MSLKIAIVNRQGHGGGGATRAAQRLLCGLLRRGHEVTMLSLSPDHAPEGIGVEASVSTDVSDRFALRANDLLQEGYIGPRRTALSNTLFSAEVAGCSFLGSDVLDGFDVINIHWVPGFVAPHNVEGIVARGKPVVFTLHDMAAFTGGCHYSAGCRGYRERCAPCPQIEPDLLGLASWTLAQKRRTLRVPTVAAIAPSQWLAECAAASGVFAPGQVRVVPNGLDTDVFRPTGKAVAKRGLGLPGDVRTLLFGAETGREHRKGFDLLLSVLAQLQADPVVSSLLSAQRVRVLTFGKDSEALKDSGIPVLNLGVVEHDARLALIYSAADVLVLPSREDNLPNILIEAMACATPVVAFASGGALDVIEDGHDGRLIPCFDTAAMATAVALLLKNEGAALTMGAVARDKMATRFNLDVQAAAYEAFFAERIGSSRPLLRIEPARAPSTLALPVTLHPDIATLPLGLFVEQQARIADLHGEVDRLGNDLARVKHVLARALAEARGSTSWRATHWMRAFKPDTELARLASAEAIAVELLTLLRSKSWELTAPIRTAVRLVRAGLRAPTAHFKRARRPAVPVAVGTTGPEHVNAPLQLESVLATTGRLTSPASQGLNIICLHLFHLDQWDEFKAALRPIIGPDTPLYLSLPETAAHFESRIRQDFSASECVSFVVENRGLDVMPFLYQFRFLREHCVRPLTLTKLHTKRSTHVARDDGNRWRHELYQPLLAHHAAIVDQFRRNPRLGMVCCRKWWLVEAAESLNFQAESRVIAEACELFDIPRAPCYLSGSMYVVSFEYLETLFAGVDLDAYLATFPPGYRPSDTPAHAFERIICYGLEKHGYQVGVL